MFFTSSNVSVVPSVLFVPDDSALCNILHTLVVIALNIASVRVVPHFVNVLFVLVFSHVLPVLYVLEAPHVLLASIL